MVFKGEGFKRVVSFVYVALAVFCDLFLLKQYKVVYGPTLKFYILLGMGMAVLYTLMVHFYREMVSSGASSVNGVCSAVSIVLSLITSYMVVQRYLLEDVCFYVMIATFILLLECTRLGTPFTDLQNMVYRNRFKKELEDERKAKDELAESTKSVDEKEWDKGEVVTEESEPESADDKKSDEANK